MVFQSYALYPQYDSGKTSLSQMKMAGVKKEVIAEHVKEVAESLESNFVEALPKSTLWWSTPARVATWGVQWFECHRRSSD
ncbi:hypothetical protein O9929_12580 [Vibrio lentus]|nr:hypothetical protein [Vibrio lentus]